LKNKTILDSIKLMLSLTRDSAQQMIEDAENFVLELRSYLGQYNEEKINSVRERVSKL
jgi:hypothetical protein